MKRDLTSDERRRIADLARDIFNEIDGNCDLYDRAYDDELDAYVYSGNLADAAERVIEARLVKFFSEEAGAHA